MTATHQISATQAAATPVISIISEWSGKDGQYRTFRYWMTEGWSNSVMQVNRGNGWVTL